MRASFWLMFHFNYIIYMKYIIRLIATVPMVSAALSMIISLIVAFDYPVCVLLAIGNFFAVQVACFHYEDTVHAISAFLRMLCDKTDEVD